MMGAIGRNPTPMQHQNLVGIEYTGYALGNYKGGAIGLKPVQGFLDFEFRFHINGAGAVIKYQDTGRDEQGPGNGNSLFLTA